MIYKGVEYTVTAGQPGTWKWEFRIGDRVDRELKKARE